MKEAGRQERFCSSAGRPRRRKAGSCQEDGGQAGRSGFIEATAGGMPGAVQPAGRKEACCSGSVVPSPPAGRKEACCRRGGSRRRDGRRDGVGTAVVPDGRRDEGTAAG